MSGHTDRVGCLSWNQASLFPTFPYDVSINIGAIGSTFLAKLPSCNVKIIFLKEIDISNVWLVGCKPIVAYVLFERLKVRVKS